MIDINNSKILIAEILSLKVFADTINLLVSIPHGSIGISAMNKKTRLIYKTKAAVT
ncbi:MAG: hypothetical protein IKB51_05365 [Clostridia bacterium]|nr:hypothetical protein [Clostridia bacterium]